MSTEKSGPPRDETATAVWQTTTHWMARTIAVSLLMFAPGFLGSALDQRWGTKFLAIGGFVVGMVFGTVMLLVLMKQFAPPARGKPLVIEDEKADSEPSNDE